MRQLIEAGYSEDESAVPAEAVEPLEIGDEEKEWEVDSIIGKREVDGHVQYRVRWSGFSENDATWEPLEHLDNAADHIDAFEGQQAELELHEAAGAVPEQEAAAAEAVDPEAERPAVAASNAVESSGQRRSARDHASSRALDGAASVSVSGKHVHMAMAALCGMQPGGDDRHSPSLRWSTQCRPRWRSWRSRPRTRGGRRWHRRRQPSGRLRPTRRWLPSTRWRCGTWCLAAACPRGQIVIACKWVFKIKTDEHGAVTVYKARLTPKGFMQREGINVYETFAATGKYKSMRIGLSIAAACDYELDQMDVPVAFQQAELEEEVYMELPEGYREGKRAPRVQAEEGALRPQAGAAQLVAAHQQVPRRAAGLQGDGQ